MVPSGNVTRQDVCATIPVLHSAII
jgi:hypothetical protein